MTELEEVAREASKCTLCRLCETRTKAVPGEGNLHAKVFFIGEAPGFNEDKQGRPFVGAAGQFLDQLLASVKLKRSDVFITNVVKCRPPENRDPELDEIAACNGYLERQIAAVNPQIIVTLGRHSMSKFFPGAKIGQIHGREQVKDEVIYYPMYHPAAALHQASLKKTVETDMLRLPELLAKAATMPAPKPKTSEKKAPPEEPLEQLRLF